MTDDVEVRYDGPPTVLTASATGSFRITPGERSSPRRLLLHAPAEALRPIAAGSALGHALLTVQRAASSQREAAPWIELTGPHGTARALAGISLDIEWLSACEAGRDCDVPISVTGAFGPSPGYATPVPAPDSWAEADWQLTVRLEQIGAGATAPQAELSLETVDP